MRRVGAVLLVIGLATTIGFAKKELPIKLTTKSYKEVVKVGKDGKRKVVLEDAKKIIPGDIVLYKNIIQNNSKSDAKDMVLNNSIPKFTEYVPDSASCEKGCEILFSVDGGKTYATPDKLKVKDVNGERLALPKEYTNVRWILTSTLTPNSKTYVSFKTKLK
jgi:uncharacterized repeat protein (TIGR01451 family)